MNIKQLETKGFNAVKMLRKTKLGSGLPFMIFVPSLPTNHCLLEFPNGEMKEVTINKRINDYSVIRELPQDEILQLKKKYKLD